MPNSRQSDTRIYDDYRGIENLDEISFELGITWSRGKPQFWPAGCVSVEAADVHHIFSRSGQRLHLKSNLISLSRDVHDMFHISADGAVVPIRLLCLAAKCAKSLRMADPSEFDLAELDRACGASVRGWIENATFELEWAWCERYRAELLDRLNTA